MVDGAETHKPTRISVRSLAEQLFQSGDLYPVRQGKPVDAQLGIATAQKIQRQREARIPGYAPEKQLETSFAAANQMWLLSGRADGFYSVADGWVVEEYKCVRGRPDEANAVDFAQAQLYAAMHFSSDETSLSGDSVVAYTIKLIYVDPDDLFETVFQRRVETPRLSVWMAFVLLCYETNQNRLRRHFERRTRLTKTLQFPFGDFRKSQRAIARRVFEAITRREQLLLEAPTGIGKTIAVLFPSLKGLANDDQIFFATSRSPGADAALQALQQLDPAHDIFNSVQLVAKEQVCPIEGMPCSADRCTRAQGYFNKRPAALEEARGLRFLDRNALERLADKHCVCPFELSLDVTRDADVIVGDYNYLFDPQVRLQRLKGLSGLHLLIDESHQLSPRTRSMLSVELERADVRFSLKEQPPAVTAVLKSIDRKLLDLARAYSAGEYILEHDATIALDRSITKFLTLVSEVELELEQWPATQALFFRLHQWTRSVDWLEATPWLLHLKVAEENRGVKALRLSKTCIDSAPYTAQIMSEHGAGIRFSGTVSPLKLYQRLHGHNSSGASERAQSPYQTKQLGMFLIDDIPTYFRQRQSSLNNLAGLVKTVFDTRPGRYLVALPSYDYLNLLAQALDRSGSWAESAAGEVFPPEECLPLLKQKQNMNSSERESFISSIRSNERCVGLIVMGGVFGESIDFVDTKLSGVILVGVGFPPPDLITRETEAYFDKNEGSGWGRAVAFVQPALTKVVQAAGRLLRSPEDRGVICLVDNRFKDPAVSQFFPAHWDPKITPAAGLEQDLQRFWESLDESGSDQEIISPVEG
ncbi:MAG: ATP-dependent DNA helicase [Pseudomonadota bacterium]